MSQSVWQLKSGRAWLSTDVLSATLQIAEPSTGIRELSLLPEGAALFQVHRNDSKDLVSEAAADAYVRENDLVATYGKTDQLPFAMQIYWRFLAPSPSKAIRAALEIIVSTQTSRLDSHANVTTDSCLPATEVLHLCGSDQRQFEALSIGDTPYIMTPAAGTGCLVFRVPGETVSYVEMVHPADFTESRLARQESDGSYSLQRTAVDHWMEKGVIVRARLRGLFAERQDDLATAATAYQEFCQADIPLTT